MPSTSCGIRATILTNDREWPWKAYQCKHVLSDSRDSAPSFDDLNAYFLASYSGEVGVGLSGGLGQEVVPTAQGVRQGHHRGDVSGQLPDPLGISYRTSCGSPGLAVSGMSYDCCDPRDQQIRNERKAPIVNNFPGQVGQQLSPTLSAEKKIMPNEPRRQQALRGLRTCCSLSMRCISLRALTSY